MLLEKLLLEVCREDTDGVREETEDEKEFVLVFIVLCRVHNVSPCLLLMPVLSANRIQGSGGIDECDEFNRSQVLLKCAILES